MPKKRNAIDTEATWDPKRPFIDLPRLPPRETLESIPVLKACVAARAALAELKQAAELIPNPAILLGSLPLLEAQASSEIENIVTSADELFRQMAGDSRTTPAAREALRYREALLEGARALQDRPLSTGTAERICSRIKGSEMAVRKIPGTALGNPATGKIIYTPPSGEAAIRDLLANWETFLHGADDLDPLVRMAVAHYQFEAIHPFIDGNGRTGRILNSLFLIERGLLGAPILYLSRYIIQNKPEYYSRLLDVTKSGAWEPWLLYMLDAVSVTSLWTLQKIAAIRSLAADTREHVRRTLPKTYSAELIELLFERPYCTITHVEEAGLAKRQTASKYLSELTRVGVLQEKTMSRGKAFVNTRFLQLLTCEENDADPFVEP